MRGEDLKLRTKKFALLIIKLFVVLPESTEAQIIGKQMLRSGTSVGAQYQEAGRARSNAEFISKIESCLQELDETMYWIELLIEGGIAMAEKLQSLRDEANELTAIFVASVKAVKARKDGGK
jgi:four helix bundle protein